jgi:hypothetical protein
VKENSVETSEAGIGQYIKDHLANLQSGFSKYFPEAVSSNTNGSWIHSMLIHPKIMTFPLKKRNLY